MGDEVGAGVGLEVGRAVGDPVGDEVGDEVSLPSDPNVIADGLLVGMGNSDAPVSPEQAQANLCS